MLSSGHSFIIQNKTRGVFGIHSLLSDTRIHLVLHQFVTRIWRILASSFLSLQRIKIMPSFILGPLGNHIFGGQKRRPILHKDRGPTGRYVLFPGNINIRQYKIHSFNMGGFSILFFSIPLSSSLILTTISSFLYLGSMLKLSWAPLNISSLQMHHIFW